MHNRNQVARSFADGKGIKRSTGDLKKRNVTRIKMCHINVSTIHKENNHFIPQIYMIKDKT